MRITLIAALDRNFAIGKGNALSWHLPDDLKRFKALTFGKTILTGRKTAQSLGRALPKRRNLVLTRSGCVPFEGMQAVSSLDDAVGIASIDGDELCVIGGGEIYALVLSRATHMYLTMIDTAVEGADASFPAFDASQWRVTACEMRQADATHAFAREFVDYQRIA